MNGLFFSCVLIVLVQICFCKKATIVAVPKKTTFAVALTTIPPRFSSLEDTLQTWMNQTYRPTKIFIFIPNKYKRFNGARAELSIALQKSETLGPLVRTNTIEVISLERDFGPISKFLGILWYLQSYKGVKTSNPDYWIVGDDDVGYNTTLIARYDASTKARMLKCRESNSSCTNNFGLSQYMDKIRQEFDRTRIVNGSRVFEHHKILHMQGVDTFMLPKIVASSALKLNETMRIVGHIESKCPEAFYQDDYVISFLLHVFQIEMTSIRDTMPFYGLDKSSDQNSQMHLDVSVKTREMVTKKCILNAVHFAYNVVYGDQ